MKLNSTIRQAAYPVAILGQRNFALVWSSIALFQVGSQMEAVVLSWFVLELTDSPLLVGLIASARMGLNFLALFSGAIADRLPRHRILAVIDLVMTILGLLVLALLLTGQLEAWHLFAVTLGAGLVRIFQMPSAQALVGDTLPADRISNGAALTSMGQNISTILGPLLGGLLYQQMGPTGAYSVISLLYFSSGIAIFFVRPLRTNYARPQGSVLRSVAEGLRYVKGEQVLWATLLVAVVINLTGWPFHTALMPIFARDVLGTGSAGLGLLISAFGVGALCGSVGWATVRNLRHAGKLMILCIIVWHGSMAVFALSSSLYLSLAILLVTGMAFSSTQVMMLTVMLRTTQPEFRGRVLSLRTLAIYAYTFGGAGSGWMAGLWGAPWAATVIGMVGIALTCLVAVFTPKLLRA